MLFLTRKPGQSIRVNDDIEIKVLEVHGKTVKLGFSFPENVKVFREEIYERVLQENRVASESALALNRSLESSLTLDKDNQG
jgi:carbon storage regulator